MKVSIVIAAYNEAATVATLLERVRTQPIAAAKEIILVESNSSDGTRALVEAFVATHGADPACPVRLILEPMPRGKGHAVRAGLAAAAGDIILIQDADLEYDVGDYPELLAPLLAGSCEVVLGSRHLGAGRWKIREFAGRSLQAVLMNLGGVLFHQLFNRVFGVRLTDPTTMYKVFRADCIAGLELRRNRFDFDYELLGKLIRCGHRPLEVPVTYRSRGFDQGKKIRIWRDPWTWVIAILRCRFERLGASRPATRASRAPAPAAVIRD